MSDSRLTALIRGCSIWISFLAVALFATVDTQSVSADTLDEIHRRGTLVWGGDQEGGAPFVFPDAKDPTQLVGFEAELADMLASDLGVKAKFQQGQWDRVPQMLGNQIDIALNGFERTPERMRDYLCSRPYYMYGLQLIARSEPGR
jgi:polar amino acid transport system substrate-binding protein